MKFRYGKTRRQAEDRDTWKVYKFLTRSWQEPVCFLATMVTSVEDSQIGFNSRGSGRIWVEEIFSASAKRRSVELMQVTASESAEQIEQGFDGRTCRCSRAGAEMIKPILQAALLEIAIRWTVCGRTWFVTKTTGSRRTTLKY